MPAENGANRRDEWFGMLGLLAYGTVVMILWPLERLTRRRRGER